MKLKNHIRGTTALIIKGLEIDVFIFRVCFTVSFEINLLCLPGLTVVEDKKFHAPFGRIIYFTNMYKYPIPHLKIIGAAKEGHRSQ